MRVRSANVSSNRMLANPKNGHVVFLLMGWSTRCNQKKKLIFVFWTLRLMMNPVSKPLCSPSSRWLSSQLKLTWHSCTTPKKKDLARPASTLLDPRPPALLLIQNGLVPLTGPVPRDLPEPNLTDPTLINAATQRGFYLKPHGQIPVVPNATRNRTAS